MVIYTPTIPKMPNPIGIMGGKPSSVSSPLSVPELLMTLMGSGVLVAVGVSVGVLVAVGVSVCVAVGLGVLV